MKWQLLPKSKWTRAVGSTPNSMRCMRFFWKEKHSSTRLIWLSTLKIDIVLLVLLTHFDSSPFRLITMHRIDKVSNKSVNRRVIWHPNCWLLTSFVTRLRVIDKNIVWNIFIHDFLIRRNRCFYLGNTVYRLALRANTIHTVRIVFVAKSVPERHTTSMMTKKIEHTVSTFDSWLNFSWPLYRVTQLRKKGLVTRMNVLTRFPVSLSTI